MAKDPYRGTPTYVRIGIVGVVLVDVYIIVITIAVQSVASYMMESVRSSRSRNRGLVKEY